MQTSSKRKSKAAAKPAAEAEPRDKPASIELPFDVSLVHSRRAHAGWALVGLVLGILLVWKLAIVGQLLGVVFLIIAAFAGKNLLFTLLNSPGTIVLGESSVELPVGLCRGRSRSYDWKDVRHAFYLRRAVPWTRTGPVLVIEAGDVAYTYPRDWFGSEAEQRRVLMAIQRQLEKRA